MSIRETLSNNPAMGVVVTVVLIGVAVALVLARGSTGPQQYAENGTYYMDMTSGDLFVAGADATPPVAAPSGGDGVRAHVYSCSSCSESNREVLYIEKLTDKARTLTASDDAEDAKPLTPMQMAQVQTGILVATPATGGTEPNWVSASSEEGMALIDKAQKHCSGKAAKRCNP